MGNVTGTSVEDILYGDYITFFIRSKPEGGSETEITIHEDNYVYGLEGDDIVYGGFGTDTIYGGAGDDTIEGDGQTGFTPEIMALFAGFHEFRHEGDSLEGGAGNDTLYGGVGRDYLYGGSGTNRLYGGVGDDVIYGVGIDTIDGGEGDDAVVLSTFYTLLGGPIQGGAGNDSLLLGGYFDANSGTTTFGGFETVSGTDGGSIRLFGTAGDDRLNLSTLTADNAFSVQIEAFDGNDEVVGSGGSDSLFGGFGNDSLSGGDGDDTIYGDAGTNMLSGGVGDDRIFSDGSRDMIDAGDGDDSVTVGHLYMGQLGSSIQGGDGVDTLSLRASFDGSTGAVSFGGFETVVAGAQLFGTIGADRLDLSSLTAANPFGVSIQASGGNDDIIGSGGNDTIFGEFDDDTLAGSAGDDRIYGGGGLDTARFSGTRASYAIVDQGYGFVQVTDLREGSPDGTDTLSEVERLRFADQVTDIAGVALPVVTANPESLLVTRGMTASFDVGVLLANDTAPAGQGFAVTAVGNVTGGTVTLSEGRIAITLTEAQGGFDYTITASNGDTSTARVTLAGAATSDSNDDVAAGAPYAAADLHGEAGNDYLAGGASNDRLDGGDGFDRMTGGAGDDTYVWSNARDTVIEQANEGIDTIETELRSFSLATLPNVENLTFIGTLGATLTGNAASNVIIGGGFADVIDGAAGADRMEGKAGDDTYYVDAAGDLVVESVDAGYDTVVSSVSYTLSANVERLNLSVAGSATGNALANYLKGTAGNDLLDGRGGADTMEGGDGDDTYYIDDVADVIVERNGVDTVVTTLATYQLSNRLEVLRYEGTGDFTGLGSGYANDLYGNVGNDVLNGGEGVDRMYGGQGNDTYYFSEAGDHAYENANEGDDTIYTMFSLALAAGLSIEALRAWSPGGDINLTGNELANRLVGNSGRNVLDGGAGGDVMEGGAGDDTYYVDSTGDQIVEVDNGGTDQVYASADITLTAFVEHLVLTGAAGRTANGNDLRNKITGTSGGDTIDGKGGHDAITGGDGADVLFGSAGDDALTGGVGDDVLYGGIGNDTLDGGAGGDLLSGGDGDDRLTGAADGDTISGGIGGDLLYGGTGVDTLSGEDGNDTLYGEADDDTLYGGAGNDYMYGGAGTNALFGGAGDDLYLIESATDVITEQAGEGQDYVRTALSSYTLGANLEVLTYTGAAAFTGTGNDLNNKIYGGNGDDVLTGGGGIDTLNGYGGNNTLYGGADNDFLGGTGVDQMYGGAGNDTFYVNNAGDGVFEEADEGVDTLYVTGPIASGVMPDNVENLYVLTSLGRGVQIFGNASANLLYGADGEDSLIGGGPTDVGGNRVYGGGGNDIVSASLFGRDDEVYGGTGDDLIYGGVGRSKLYGGDGEDVIDGSSSGKEGFDSGNQVYGGEGRDILWGSGGNTDMLHGEAGDDILYGGSGGRAFVYGEEGADLIYAGSGGRNLFGGSGADTFAFGYLRVFDGTPDGRLTDVLDLPLAEIISIDDFSAAEGDRIDLSELDADTTTDGDQAFAFVGAAGFTAAGQLRYEASGADLIVSGDRDGDGVADFSFGVLANGSLRGADFSL